MLLRDHLAAAFLLLRDLGCKDFFFAVVVIVGSPVAPAESLRPPVDELLSFFQLFGDSVSTPVAFQRQKCLERLIGDLTLVGLSVT